MMMMWMYIHELNLYDMIWAIFGSCVSHGSWGGFCGGL